MDIMVWMVRQEQAAPVVWERFHLVSGREVLGGNLENVTVQGLVIMGVWVRVGMLKGVTEQALATEREVGHVLKVGLVVRPAE